jgi:methylamine dehydrogenase heavy chain
LAFAAVVRAEVAPETVGRVETLALPAHPHWVWVGDAAMKRIALVDLDSGRLLGTVPSGYWLPEPLFPVSRDEIYLAETHFSRGTRGERTDVLAIYDTATLEPRAEVVLPPRRALNALAYGNAALSDDERFAAVLNMTPATSLSIVDLQERRFAGEIATPGCALVYGAGARRFAMLCADGALLTVELDENGAERAKVRSAPFFDPRRDPVTEKAARHGDVWLFPSFEGRIHAVDVSGETPRFEAPWSLFDEADRQERWRIGGSQHLAVHERTGRLFALVHQGGEDTHKEAGSEVWVYDLATRSRVQRIDLLGPGITYLGEPIEIGRDWIWPFDRVAEWFVASVNPGTDAIQVTQDEIPRLAAVSVTLGGIGIYDAVSGEFIGRAYSGNLTNAVLEAPFGRAPRSAAR